MYMSKGFLRRYVYLFNSNISEVLGSCRRYPHVIDLISKLTHTSTSHTKDAPMGAISSKFSRAFKLPYVGGYLEMATGLFFYYGCGVASICAMDTVSLDDVYNHRCIRADAPLGFKRFPRPKLQMLKIEFVLVVLKKNYMFSSRRGKVPNK